MTNKNLSKIKFFTYFLIIFTCLLGNTNLYSQVVSWGPSVPAVSSNNINTCYDDEILTIEFTNAAGPLTDITLEVQLGTGVNYIPNSLVTINGPITIAENDISNLNNPTFIIGALASLEKVTISIDRNANCDAQDAKIGGATFQDIVTIYEAGTEVIYSNGASKGIAGYDIIYGSLSITNINTNPSTNNINSSSQRNMIITNGSFGIINEFYFADVFDSGALDLNTFVINPSGINYTIPIQNISTVGDSIIIHFTATEIVAIDGSTGSNGNGDTLFEKDEEFTLSYNVSPNNCGMSNTISSELIAWWGCSYQDRCQIATSNSSIGLNNSTPEITLSDASSPKLDFCDTVTYSIKLTNTSLETSPTGGSFASDVTAILGLRSNNSAIATLSNMTMWGPDYRNNKIFTNHKLNGYPVILPTVPGLNSSNIPYLPPNYFTVDPDGPGGLTDIDGDGFFDDLSKDSVLVISYDVHLNHRDRTCSLGRADYGFWEHISADISWHNQCGILMSPKRKEFNYTNMIRDYNNTTFFDFPSDIDNGQDVNIGIKPHLFTGYSCNGGDGYNSGGVEWTKMLVLPPGFSMQPGYDTNIYSVSNDTVKATGAYVYDWTYFPLKFDCTNWDGANPVTLQYKTMYACSNGTDICFEEEIHCFDATIVPHCPSPCTGVNIESFAVNRISESWTDDTKTSLVDLDDPAIIKDYVYALDTVSFDAVGVISDTMSENLHIRFSYTPEDGGDIFDYLDGEITIIDIDGEFNGGMTHYTFPLNSGPVVTNPSGDSYEAVFDLSSYRTLIDPTYKYGQSSIGPPSYDSDTIIFAAKYVIKSSISAVNNYAVNDFRARYFLIDSNNEEMSCNSRGTQLNYQRPTSTAGFSISHTNGCSPTNHNFFLTLRTATNDDHPEEYRPSRMLDSAFMVIPIGWDIGTVKWIDGNIMDAADYSFRGDSDTLVLRRPAGYADHDKIQTFFPRMTIEMFPSCEALNGNNNISYSAYYKDFAYLTDPSSHVPNITTDNRGHIVYTAPTTTITPLNQSAPAYQDTISWDVSICNSTSDMDISYNWLLLNSNSGLITIDSIYDITGGSSTLLMNSLTTLGSTYVEIENLDRGDCKDIRIFARFSSCSIDTLSIEQGWSCIGYPNIDQAVGCAASNEVYVLPQSSQISTTVTPLINTPDDPSNPAAGNYGNTTVNMCDQFPAEVTVVNAQSGYLYDVNLTLQIPSAGSGFTYVPGSATIELEGVDLVNTPRVIGAVAEAALVAASSGNNATWAVTLADLDPTNFGNNEGLIGTTNASQNEFILRWKMESTCNLVSGDNFVVIVNANEPCGNPAQGSGEQVNGYPLDIDGVVTPYYVNITNTLSPNNTFEGCNDSKTVEINLLLSGGTTGTTDSLKVTLPTGITYDGGYNCSTPGKCPLFVNSTITNGVETINFSYPSGQDGAINFEFDISTNSRGTCSNTQNLLTKSITAVPGLSCGSGSCSSALTITGQRNTPIILEKPILSVDILSMNYISSLPNNTIAYSIELENTGIDASQDIVVEFFCLNATEDDIIGMAIAKDTLSGGLLSNSIQTLSSEFNSPCSFGEGIGVIITPAYDNCYCGALDNLSEKSAGLNEIPHDIKQFLCDPCDNSCDLFTDIDMDGIGDVCDLDNDNDGILDLDECPAVSSGQSGVIAASDLSFDISGTPSDFTEEHLLNSVTVFGATYADFIAPDAYSTTLVQPTTIGTIYILENAANPFDYYTSGVNWLTDAGAAYQSRNLNYLLAIDGDHGNTLYNQIHYVNPIKVTAGFYVLFMERNLNNNIGIEAFDASGNPLGTKQSYTPSDYVGTGVQISREDLISGEEAGLIVVPIEDFANLGDKISSFRIYTEHETTDEGDGKVLIFGDLSLLTCDTDNDGTLNHLDTDSDNDGCPDALEGDGAFTFINIQNDTLTGGVDPNGVPIVATVTGQTIGTSQDNTQLGSACTTFAKNDFNNTLFETEVSADVSTNDTEQVGNNQAYNLTSPNGGMNIADGTVILNNNGSYTFTPSTGFIGTTEFQYEVCDDGTPALCDTATVYIEVLPTVNPEAVIVIANPDVNTVLQNQTGTGSVMTNDLDPDDLKPTVTTTFTNQSIAGVDENGNLVSNAGALTLNSDGTYSFIPTAGFTGVLSQPYTICNAEAPAICDDSELIINVLPNTNNTTFANDDAVVTDTGVTINNDISANDSDSEMDGQLITTFLVDTNGDGKGDIPGTIGTPTTLGGTNYLGVFIANAGEITLNNDGTYSFTPAPGFIGNINIPYTTCDDTTTNMACENATLIISVLDVKRDYGDAPVSYPAAWHRALTDSDDNNVLDGTTDVWLGMNTNFENIQQSSANSTDDQFDDAITFGSGTGQFPLIAQSGTSYDVNIILNSAQPDLVFYGMWIDWNSDGIYDDFHAGSQVTASPTTAVVTITAPATIGNNVNVRLRADDNPFIATDFSGGKTNGEVEDYQALVVLPVTLTHFSGQRSGCNISVRWHAETEESFSHYEIERSDDQRIFSTIKTINGTGNASTGIWYTYTDKTASQFNYYRLKMVDLDGSIEYSKIISLSTDCPDESKIELYPNPSSNNLGVVNVKFYSKSHEVQLQVVDMQGQVVKQLIVSTEQEALNSLRLDVTGLSAGAYHLNVIQDGKGNTKAFVITNE